MTGIRIIMISDRRPGCAPGFFALVIVDENVFSGFIFMKVWAQKPCEAVGLAVFVEAVACGGGGDHATVDFIGQKVAPRPRRCRVVNYIFTAVRAEMSVRHTNGYFSKKKKECKWGRLMQELI